MNNDTGVRSMSKEYEIISFNTNGKNMQTNNWLSKFSTIMQNHNDNNPNIIITQEFNHRKDKDLQQVINKLGNSWGYLSTAKYKNVSPTQNDALFYRKDIFSVNDLSKNYLGSRIQCVEFTDKVTDKVFIVINTHLPYDNPNSITCKKSKQGQYAYILKSIFLELEREKKCGIIVGGDFNYGVPTLSNKWGDIGNLPAGWTVDDNYSIKYLNDNGLQTTLPGDSPWDHFITNNKIDISHFGYALSFNNLLITIGNTVYHWNDGKKPDYREISNHAPIKMKFTVV